MFPILKYGLYKSDFLLKKMIWEEGEKTNFKGEKPGKHYLTQVIKVSSMLIRCVDMM